MRIRNTLSRGFAALALAVVLTTPLEILRADDVNQEPAQNAESNLLYDSSGVRTEKRKKTADPLDAYVVRISGEKAESAQSDVEESAPVLFLFDEDEETLPAPDFLDVDDADPVAKEDSPEADDGTDVLIDMRHAHDFSDFPLTLDDLNYHRIYSFNKAFEYLRSQGVRVEKHDQEDVPLSAEILAKCKTLFLNLPSGDKAPFLVGEIAAIKDFILNGGSVVLITDHTNCYFHQSRLTPLFHEIDLEPQPYGVCDRESAVGTGEGWLFISRFDRHPVTEGLREIAFQTGGGVDPRFAVAWSSETSWQDAPGMPIYGETDLAYYGNFAPDPGERVGSSGVILAREYGKGKIVVVGDQNLFSAFYLQYLDIYRLWCNVFSWTLDRPELADLSRYAEEAGKGTVLLCWEDLGKDAARFGDPDPNGYYHLWTLLCRRYNLFAIAHPDTEQSSKILMILRGDEGYSAEGRQFALDHLLRGEALFVIDPARDVLDRAETALAGIVADLKAKGIEATREEGVDPMRTERLTLSNGGRIVLVRGRYSLSNSGMPRPEVEMRLIHQENLRALVNEISAALSPDEEEKGSKTDPTPGQDDNFPEIPTPDDLPEPVNTDERRPPRLVQKAGFRYNNAGRATSLFILNPKEN